MTTAASLADRVTTPLMASSTGMVWPGLRSSLVGSWSAAWSETLSGGDHRRRGSVGMGGHRRPGEGDRLRRLLVGFAGAVGDHRRGAMECRFLDMFADQTPHRGVALSTGTAAHDDADDKAAVAMHRRENVEAGGTGEPGLDTVEAFDRAEQMIVSAYLLAVIDEGFGREIFVEVRKAVLDGAAEQRLVARRGELVVVRQT